jgi:hypothetical protein
MTKARAARTQDRRRFAVNLALLVVAATAGWVWFNVHLKPHVDARLFGSISITALVVFAGAIVTMFVKTGFAELVAPWLPFRGTTWALGAAIAVIALAFLTTATLYVSLAGNAPSTVVLISKRKVELSPNDRERALTYLVFRAPAVSVETESPRGYDSFSLPLRRGFPTELTVPDPAHKATAFVVRLVPLKGLISALRGRRNTGYQLRISVLNRMAEERVVPLEFRAVYVGGGDLQEAASRGRTNVATLRQRLGASHIPPAEQEKILGEWLDNPLLIETPPLQKDDRVRARVVAPDGHVFDTPVSVATEFTDEFLKGVSE